MKSDADKAHPGAGTPLGEEGANSGLRFPFGQNWLSFLPGVNEVALVEAKNSITRTLGRANLTGELFLDIGCGSGLFSLAARGLGATVLSFDFDEDSVRCTRALKSARFPDDGQWTIRRGSILDAALVQELGRFDVVYAWGVLHHTGRMWDAIHNTASMVRVGGDLIVAIYNDQGHWSRVWFRIKQIYNRLPKRLRPLFVFLVAFPRELRSLAFSVITLQPSRYMRSWSQYHRTRGMSKWHDLVDWVGGLPFEVARPEQVIFFLKERGFDLRGLNTCAGEIGCNEFAFRRLAAQ
jgi:2-polyprenyl-6-hydroxyphenyl methylase/3-demethylubiquinone-9 3-methyltransferase